MTDVIVSKVANCLVPDVSTTGTWMMRAVTRWMGKRMGGLWVGGRITLTATRLEFEPNIVNIALHDGDTNRAIALRDVTAVEDRGGIFTKIVHVDGPDGGVTFRCYGARKVSQRVREAVAAAR
ncbi:hypothetical protein [Aeromicrobium sp. NPDC092404]|uniref:hypothetical protein n=1 Tax=Aeromicrobium sp. NPDC092404 TaxID=3154976 RepID=UPI0034244FF4